MKLKTARNVLGKIGDEALALLDKVEAQQHMTGSDLARVADLWARYGDQLDAMIDDPIPSSEFSKVMTDDELFAHIAKGMAK